MKFLSEKEIVLLKMKKKETKGGGREDEKRTLESEKAKEKKGCIYLNC